MSRTRKVWVVVLLLALVVVYLLPRARFSPPTKNTINVATGQAMQVTPGDGRVSPWLEEILESESLWRVNHRTYDPSSKTLTYLFAQTDGQDAIVLSLDVAFLPASDFEQSKLRLDRWLAISQGDTVALARFKSPMVDYREDKSDEATRFFFPSKIKPLLY